MTKYGPACQGAGLRKEKKKTLNSLFPQGIYKQKVKQAVIYSSHCPVPLGIRAGTA